jgi:hypothetical protein
MRVSLEKTVRHLRHAASALAIVMAVAAPADAAEQQTAALNTPGAASSASPQIMGEPSPPPHVYVEVIVKACPQVEMPLQPINQGHSYDDDKPMTHQERMDYYAEIGCVDVPIPPEWMTQEMTYEGCKGHAGYLASLQFLRQRQDLKKFPAVGYWMCIPHPYPVQGVAGM